jgi:hypothetical protein
MKPRKDVLYLVIMSWLVFTTLVMPQLVLTRCLLQPTYRWSNVGFSGAVRDLRRKRQPFKPGWPRRNVIGLIIAVALWFVAAALFRIGSLHGPANIAAVLCMFAFWIVLNGCGLRAAVTPLSTNAPTKFEVDRDSAELSHDEAGHVIETHKGGRASGLEKSNRNVSFIRLQRLGR